MGSEESSCCSISSKTLYSSSDPSAKYKSISNSRASTPTSCESVIDSHLRHIMWETKKDLTGTRIINILEQQVALATTQFIDTVKQHTITEPLPPGAKTVIVITSNDCLEVALWLQPDEKAGVLEPRPKPLVIACADELQPCGSAEQGGYGQEESLSRRTNLWSCLQQPVIKSCYPLPEFGGIYVQNLALFRSAEDKGCKRQLPVRWLSAWVMAPYTNTELTANGSTFTSQFAQKIKAKIGVIFNLALLKGHRRIVLGIFGSHDTHPPKALAELYLEVLCSSQFRNQFEVVAFSLFPYDSNQPSLSSNPSSSLMDDCVDDSRYDSLAVWNSFVDTFTPNEFLSEWCTVKVASTLSGEDPIP